MGMVRNKRFPGARRCGAAFDVVPTRFTSRPQYDAGGAGVVESNGWMPTQSKFNVLELVAQLVFLCVLPRGGASSALSIMLSQMATLWKVCVRACVLVCVYACACACACVCVGGGGGMHVVTVVPIKDAVVHVDHPALQGPCSHGPGSPVPWLCASRGECRPCVRSAPNRFVRCATIQISV